MANRTLMTYLEICTSLLFLFLVSYTQECPHRPSLNGYRYKNIKLKGHEINNLKGALSPYTCADACLRDPRCRSFNFKRKRYSNDINECTINDINNEKAKSGEVQEDFETDFYDVGYEALQKVCLTHDLVKFVVG